MLKAELLDKLHQVRPASSNPGMFAGMADLFSLENMSDASVLRHAWDGEIVAILELARRVDDVVWADKSVNKESIQGQLLKILFTINSEPLLELDKKILPQLYKISPMLQLAAFLYFSQELSLIESVLKQMARIITEITITMNRNGFDRHRAALLTMKLHEKSLLEAARKKRDPAILALIEEFDRDSDREKLFCSLLYSNLEPADEKQQKPFRDFWNEYFAAYEKDAMQIEAPVLKAEGKDDFLKLLEQLYFEQGDINELLREFHATEELHDYLSAFVQLFQQVSNMRLKVAIELPDGIDYYSYAQRMVSPLVLGMIDIIGAIFEKLKMGEPSEKIKFNVDIEKFILGDVLPDYIRDFSEKIEEQEKEIERIESEDARSDVAGLVKVIAVSRGYSKLPEEEQAPESIEAKDQKKAVGLVKE